MRRGGGVRRGRPSAAPGGLAARGWRIGAGAGVGPCLAARWWPWRGVGPKKVAGDGPAREWLVVGFGESSL